jgi:hypothetical protein
LPVVAGGTMAIVVNSVFDEGAEAVIVMGKR